MKLNSAGLVGGRSKESSIGGGANRLVGVGWELIPFPGIAWTELTGEIVAPAYDVATQPRTCPTDSWTKASPRDSVLKISGLHGTLKPSV